MNELLEVILNKDFGRAIYMLKTERGKLLAQETDDKDALPLHYAMKVLADCFAPNNRESSCCAQLLVFALARTFPNGLMALDQTGTLPIHHAAESPHLPSAVLRDLLNSCPPECFRQVDLCTGQLLIHKLLYRRKTFGDPEYKLMKFLIEAYPQGLRKFDSLGNLPVHILAFKPAGKHRQAVQYMYKMDPDCFSMPTRAAQERLPIELTQNSRTTLEHFCTVCPETLDQEHRWTPENIDHPVVKWMKCDTVAKWTSNVVEKTIRHYSERLVHQDKKIKTLKQKVKDLETENKVLNEDFAQGPNQELSHSHKRKSRAPTRDGDQVAKRPRVSLSP